jgi:hypothetical protein
MQTSDKKLYHHHCHQEKSMTHTQEIALKSHDWNTERVKSGSDEVPRHMSLHSVEREEALRILEESRRAVDQRSGSPGYSDSQWSPGNLPQNFRDEHAQIKDAQLFQPQSVTHHRFSNPNSTPQLSLQGSYNPSAVVPVATGLTVRQDQELLLHVRGNKAVSLRR